MINSTFKELCESHRLFLKNFGLDNYLTTKLLNFARKVYNYRGNLSNQYYIARKVEAGNFKESYKAYCFINEKKSQFVPFVYFYA